MLLDQNIGYVKIAASIKAVLVFWREGIMSRRGVVKHFFTKQELKDKCEQTSEYLRIDLHAGRRTNFDCLSVVQGCKNKNQLLTLEGIHFLEDDMM